MGCTGNSSANWEMGWEMGYFKTIPGNGWEMGRVKMGEHWWQHFEIGQYLFINRCLSIISINSWRLTEPVE